MEKLLNIKENAKKTKLVESGRILFYKYGYRKVTVEEICRNAGISKMTFYRFFANKIELVRFIITGLAEEGMRNYQDIMSRDISFEEKIGATIRMKLDGAEQYSDELLKDIYEDTDRGLVTLIQQLSGEIMVRVMEDYRLAQQGGQIRKDLHLHFIPYFLNQINNMVKDPVLLEMYHGNIREVMKELTNFFFYGILASHEKRVP